MSQSQKSELNADKTAISIAQRRNYSETEEAAQHLLTAIETVPRIEGRSGLDFSELIRCQNLRAIMIAGFSPIAMPGNKTGDR
jgi:GAF domain-containing protein